MTDQQISEETTAAIFGGIFVMLGVWGLIGLAAALLIAGCELILGAYVARYLKAHR